MSMVTKYTWAAVDFPGQTAQVKYICVEHWCLFPAWSDAKDENSLLYKLHIMLLLSIQYASFVIRFQHVNHATVDHERNQLSDVWDWRASQSAINLCYLI